MRGSWDILIDPENPDRIIIRRGADSVRKLGAFSVDDLDWVKTRLRQMESYEANLVAHPYEQKDSDEFIDVLRARRKELGLTFADVAGPMGMASTRIKASEEGASEPKWSNLKLWAWLLGKKFVLVDDH